MRDRYIARVEEKGTDYRLGELARDARREKNARFGKKCRAPYAGNGI
jgi:hypothetical protein